MRSAFFSIVNAGRAYSALFSAITAGAIFLASHAAFGAVASTATTESLIYGTSLSYLGAFALPLGNYGTSDFTYGGNGLTFYRDPSTGMATLFLEGHSPGQVAQVAIPSQFVKSQNWSALPQASVIQPFTNITQNTISQIDPGNQTGNYIYGMLPYNGRLILGASNTYSDTQTLSQAVLSSTSFSSATFSGWYKFSSLAPPRAVGGTMIMIPPEWQSLLGGPALAGEFGLSVVSTTSFGPTATVFNPDDVGKLNPIPGTTLLFYPETNPACGAVHCEDTQNDVFNLAIEYAGMAFPVGSRSILFITMQGTGPYCYGYGVKDASQATTFNSDGSIKTAVYGADGVTLNCYDPIFFGDKGPHAYPYQDQILAYDANDLLAVKSGSMQTWQPKPYAIIPLTDMPPTWGIKGATYDSETGDLYIASAYGDYPRIDVYHINVSTSPTPSAPGSVTVNY